MCIFLSLLIAASCFAADPPVRRVDAIILAVPSVDEAKRLHQIFTQQLELPSAWPVTNYGTFTSGGVFLGNLNLELDVASDVEPYKFEAVQFEPRDTGHAYSELRERGMILDEEKPFIGLGPDGKTGEQWRNARLPQLERDGLSMFFLQILPAMVRAKLRTA